MFTNAVKEENVRNLKNSAQEFRNAANDTLEDAKTDLREAASRAGRKARGLLNTASDEIIHAKDAVETQIRSKPVQSSLAALGIGFILGALFRR